MDPSLIAAGIALTHELDDSLGVSRKQTLSQRDVPGMTRGIIPVLKRSNVTGITIGANDGSTPPDVPIGTPFVWKDATSGESLFALFTWLLFWTHFEFKF